MRIKTGLLIILLSCGSCNEKIFTADVDCDDCYLDKPESGDVQVSVTISYKYPWVPVTIYSGDIEDNRIVVKDTLTSSTASFYLPVNRRYSIKAEYNNSDGTKTFVVDGTNFKTLMVNDACDAHCYVYANDKLDVRIRKEFQ